jgi:hypothetical protein
LLSLESLSLKSKLEWKWMVLEELKKSEEMSEEEVWELSSEEMNKKWWELSLEYASSYQAW